MYPFRLTVHQPGLPPAHDVFMTRDDMMARIKALVKGRTVGQIIPYVWGHHPHDGSPAWVEDMEARRLMAGLIDKPALTGHKAMFKVAAKLFASLAAKDAISADEQEELWEVVHDAFTAAGIMSLHEPGNGSDAALEAAAAARETWPLANP